MPFVYVIRSSKTGRYYVGGTGDLCARLRAHHQGRTRSLKRQGPFALVHVEQYDTVSQARKRERQIKRYKGGRAFQRLLENSTTPSSSLV